jgi:hypothetical protein
MPRDSGRAYLIFKRFLKPGCFYGGANIAN